MHQRSKALGYACQETEPLLLRQAFYITDGRCSLFYPDCSLREASIDKTTYMLRKKIFFSEYFSFSFGAKYYIPCPQNRSAVFKCSGKGKPQHKVSVAFPQSFYPLAQQTVPHRYTRGRSSVLHFAYLDLKCAQSEYSPCVHTAVLSQLAAVGLTNWKLNCLGVPGKQRKDRR